MKIYPYNSAIILNDSVFTQYGGRTGTTTPQMRNSCYQIAEQQMSSYIDTLLLPTVITGTADYYTNPVGHLSTDYGYVDKLLWIRVQDPQEKTLFYLSGTYSFAVIQEDTYGYIHTEDLFRFCGLYTITPNRPFKFQYCYEAGLPTGVATQPAMLTALTTAAQLVLNELEITSSNETTGDAGVTEFSSLNYSEKRKPWKNTAFGSSPKAAWIAHLVDSTIKKARKVVMMGR